MIIPECPDPLPDELRRLAKALACAWITHPSRPKVPEQVIKHWNQLIDVWIATKDMPLFVRKYKKNRGSIVPHPEGRDLVPCDNSPAHWVFALALRHERPPIQKIQQLLKDRQIPAAMALDKDEVKIAEFRCCKQPENLNEKGWKICHIDPVGLGCRGPLDTIALDHLKQHFRRAMNPHNMFLVPKVWSGLGEMPEMIEAAISVR